MRVYEALALAVRQQGVETLFGLMGDGNMALMASLEAELGVTTYHARHEGHAVGMADGYARKTGRVGVASVTCGPGLSQISTSLLMASRHRTPLVVLAGEVLEGHLQWFDQGAFVRACESEYLRLRSARTVHDDVRRAFHTALRERRPVVLGLSMDVQYSVFPGDAASNLAPAKPSPAALVSPSPAAISTAADMLVKARRPVIVAGVGAMAAGAIGTIEMLAERVGALLATSLFGNGAFAGNPREVGIAGGYTFELVRERLIESDLVIGVGASLNSQTMDGAALFPKARILHISDDPMALVGGERAPDLLLCGDALLAVRGLLAELERRGHSSSGYEVTGGKASLLVRAREAYLANAAAEVPSDGGSTPRLDPRAAVAALDAAVPEDAIVSIGGGHFWSFPISILTARRQHHWSFALDFGSIGHGLLLGIGAATADPGRPTLIVEGDASLLMNISALELVGRHQLPILIVVLNDEALGAEFHKLRAMGLPPELSAAPSPELAGIARGFGIEAVTVSTLEQLRSTLQSWVGQPLPKFLDLRVSREVVSPLFMRGRNETLAVARAMREEDTA